MNRIKLPPGTYHVQIDGDGSGDIVVTETGATYTDEFGNVDEWFWVDEGGWRLFPEPPARTILIFYDTGEVIRINLKTREIMHGDFHQV